MALEDVLARLAGELGLGGGDDARALVSRWFEMGQALAGPASSPPEPVQEIEAAGPHDAAVYSRVAELQALWLVVTGAKAEYEQAVAAGETDAQARLVKALGVLVAATEEEDEAIQAAVKARSN